VVTAPTLIQQLHGKVDELRRMSDQLRNGEFLRPVITQANDESVWIRGPQVAFSGWIGALDAWMRNQLVGALDAVRHKIEAYVRDFDNAQQAFANGIPGVALPPPPGPVGLTPPSCPYPFHLERAPGRTNPAMNPDLMRRGLGNALGRAKEELHAFSKRLGDVLSEPAPVPGAPVVPGAPPMRHLPPDAREAAGVPAAYQAIEVELEKALQDILDRAQTWEDAQAADESPSLGGGLLGLGLNDFRETIAKLEELSGSEAQPIPVPQPTPEAQAPAPVQPPVEEQQAEADRLAKEYPPDKVLGDPRKLQELAQKLNEHPGQEAFAARFIEKFGANNFLQVPRTLQAWEHRRVYSGGMTPPNERYLSPDKVRDEPKPGEVEQILYAFSATLATTSTSEDLTEQQQDALDEIVKAKDALALSWLLTDNKHVFDTEFLVQSFAHVKKNIEDEARDAANLVTRTNYATGPITGRDGELLSGDLKVGILNAISRNPEAALELTNLKFKPIDVPVFAKKPDKIDNPVDLLYRHGKFEDKGAALGRMMKASHDQLQHLADSAGRETEQGMASLTRANEITLRMAHEAAYGREQIDRIVVGLAPILAAQHMDDLQESVLNPGDAQYGLGKSVVEAADQALFIGKATAARVDLSAQQVEDILTAICVDPEAERTFGEGLARHQTKLITENLAQQKPAGEGSWARNLGALTGKYVNAAGNHAMGEFEAAEARRAQQLAIFDTVVELAPVVGKAVSATAGNIVEGVLKYATLPAADFEQLVKDIHFVAPSRDAVLNQIDNFTDELDQRVTASLGSIALETGLLGDRMSVKTEVEAEMRAQAKKDGVAGIPTFFDQDGHLIKPSELNDEQKGALGRWLHSPKVMGVIGPSLNDYKLAMLGEIKER
jgi:hypothetical protein